MTEYKLYQYPTCSTCRKAVKWLDLNQVSYEKIHIVEETPEAGELQSLIENSGLPFGKFFNTSGKRYRELGLKDKIAQMSIEEAVNLLSSDGMLIKRPIIFKNKKVIVGFHEAEWKEKID